jgi:hypothetical protein
VFENRELGRLMGLIDSKKIGDWRKLHNEKLHLDGQMGSEIRKYAKEK